MLLIAHTHKTNCELHFLAYDSGPSSTDLMSLRNIRCPQDLEFDGTVRCGGKRCSQTIPHWLHIWRGPKACAIPAKVSNNLCWIHYVQFSFSQPGAREVMQRKRLCRLACTSMLTRLGASHRIPSPVCYWLGAGPRPWLSCEQRQRPSLHPLALLNLPLTGPTCTWKG